MSLSTSTTHTQIHETYPGPEAEPVEVRVADADTWSAVRTFGQQIVASIDKRRSTLDHVPGMAVSMTAFVVTSIDAPEHRQGVVVARESGGHVFTICSCMSALLHRPCWHAALALDEIDAWPADMPLRDTPDRVVAVRTVLGAHHNASRWHYVVGDLGDYISVMVAGRMAAPAVDVAIRDALDALRSYGVRCRKSRNRPVVEVSITAMQALEAVR